jgi:hypothetical protein
MAWPRSSTLTYFGHHSKDVMMDHRLVNQKQQNILRFKEQEIAVRETLLGYAQAAAFVEQERIKRLAQMTPEEARAIYDDLCRSWVTWARDRDLERLEQWRMETLLAVREAMARLARVTGQESGSE